MSARQAAPLADGRALARSWLRSGGTTTTQSPNEAAARPPCDGGGRCGSSSDNRPGCPRVPDGFTVGRPPEGGRPVLRTSRGSPCAHLYTGGRAGDPRAQRAVRLLFFVYRPSSFFPAPRPHVHGGCSSLVRRPRPRVGCSCLARRPSSFLQRSSSAAAARTWRWIRPRAPPASTRRVVKPRATPQLILSRGSPSAMFIQEAGRATRARSAPRPAPVFCLPPRGRTQVGQASCAARVRVGCSCLARRPPSIPAGPLTRSGQRILLRILLRILSSLRALGTEPGDGARPGGRALAARINTNNPYANSPTKTLLRLLLPKNDQIRLTFRLATRRPKTPYAARSP